jgi:hypothetical protein
MPPAATAGALGGARVACGFVAGRRLVGNAAGLVPVPADAAGVRALGSPWRRELYAAAPRRAACLVRFELDLPE